ncbi:SusC/RagA family TonB-linked outer membrane protein [soil metagenome]
MQPVEYDAAQLPRERRLRRRGWLAAILTLCLIPLAAASLAAQEGSVGGVVIAEQSLRPLQGAQIVVVGTGRGTITDASGRFLITGLTGPEVQLQVRMLGYRNITQPVRVGDTSVRITLAESAVELDEVVVTGTAGGTQRRAVGNVVSRIRAEDVVQAQPIRSVQDLINARAPGVVIMPGTGQVGSGSRVRIRGLSSLSLSQEPLLYVDGVRVNNAQGTGPVTQGFGSSVISRMNDFNPDDIESIEIIKGPAAATLYGTEAANGVIQIITKRGNVGAPRFTLAVKQGANWFANPGDRIYTNWGPDPRTGEVVPINVYVLEKTGANREDSQGRDLFRTGHLQEYDLSVSGGSQDVRYYVAGNFERNEGVQPDNQVRRYSSRANLTINPHEKVDVAASVGYVQGRTNLSWESGAGGITWSTYFARPDRLYNRDGTFNFRRGFWSGTPEAYYAFEDWQDVQRFTGSLQLDYRTTPWLTQRLIVGTDQTREGNVELIERNDEVIPFFASSARGYREEVTRGVQLNTIDYSGTASFDVRESLRSSTSVGAQYYNRYSERVNAYGEDFPAPGLRSIDAAAIRRGGHDYVENATIGAFLQQQFGLMNRFFLTGAIRADDNSAFGESFDLVYYPKLSASWVISEEPFWALPFVNSLRLRAAYGESGQQPETFAALRTFAPVAGPDDVSAVTPQLVGNPNLGPERGREIEVGFDAGVLNDRVGLELTYYHTTTRDAILLRDIAPSTGFSGSQYINAGEIRNRGVELLARARPVVTPRVEWDLSFNIATNANEIISLGDPDLQFVTAGSFLEHRVGYPVSAWFEKRLVSAELDAEGGPINQMCYNGSGGVVPCAQAPRLYLGRPTPRYEGAFNTSLTLMGSLRLGALVDFKMGHTKLDGDRRVRCWFFALCRQNYFPLEYDAVEIAGIEGQYLNDILFPGDFTKLREVSASYSLPQRLTGQFGTDRVTLTMAARNLYTWTKYPGMEPEAMFLSTGSRGGQAQWEQNVLPQLQQFVATLNVSF